MRRDFKIGRRYLTISLSASPRHLYFSFRHGKGVPVRGILNMATDGSGRRVFFADFDRDAPGFTLKKMIAGLERACARFGVSAFYLWKTQGGFHAVSPELGSMAEAAGWALEAGADRQFVAAGLRRPENALVLRFGPDKAYAGWFEGAGDRGRDVDRGHLLMLHEFGATGKPYGVMSGFDHTRLVGGGAKGRVRFMEYVKFPHARVPPGARARGKGGRRG